MDDVVIIHHCSPEQVDTLFDVFAKPVEQEGELQWQAPAWLFALQDTTKT
jgi:hypothetical protein